MKKKDLFIRFSGYISVGFIAMVFVAMGLITISKTGRSVSEIVIESALGFIVGLLIDSILGLQGLSNGKRNDLFLETRTLHGETVDGISPHIHELDSWCAKKNSEALKLQRTRILAAEEMKYDDYFDQNGQGKGFSAPKANNKYEEKKYKRMERAYAKALKLRLTQLSAAALTSDSVRPEDPHYLGESENEYKRHAIAEDAIKKAGVALIFGYYTVEQLISFSPAALIWRLLQVSVYIVTGVTKMISSQNFIINDYRQQIIRKVNYLLMFKNDIERGGNNGELKISGE